MHSRPTLYESGVYKIHFSGAASVASVKPQGAAISVWLDIQPQQLICAALTS